MKRLAVVDGIRSAFCKAGGVLKNTQADDIGAEVFGSLVARLAFDKKLIDEVIIGNVATPSHAANVARVVAIKAGVDISTPAFTVSRNCASGMEAVQNAIVRVNAGYGRVYLVGGVESMSNIPLMFNKKMISLFEKMFKAKTISQKLLALASFRPSFLQPVVGVTLGLTDPTCGLIMGKTAENISKDFAISRADQDAFALRSHHLAEACTKAGGFKDEILPIFCNKEKGEYVLTDDGIRNGQNIEALAKLKPFFEKPYGTVTVGNSSQITDGGCGLVLVDEALAKEMNLNVLGYVSHFANAGCDQTRMGLGPVFAISKLLKKAGLALADIDLFEINEAFSAQVLGCLRAMDSEEFCSKNLGRGKLGEIPLEKLNINGGAIALGHPVGVSGARIILHLIHQLKQKKLKYGLASLCIGGGQGSAVLVESN